MAPHTSIQVRYAFNSALIGIESPEKPEHQFIRVSTWGSSASHKHRDPAHALTTSAGELGALDQGKELLGLWVGFKPAQAEAMRSANAKDTGNTPDDQQALEELRRIKIQRSSSVDSVAKLKKLPVWTRVDGMRRVVARFSSLHGTKLLFYELVNRDPKTMLCEAYPIDAQDVFYFHEYRTDSMTSSHDRNKEWRRNINAHLAQVLNHSLDNGGFRPARSTERAQWLKDHIGIMQHIVDSQQAGINALIDYHSRTAIVCDNLDQLWDHFGNSADTDATKHFALQATRYYAKEITSQCLKPTRLIEEYISTLNEQHKEISDTQTVADDDDMDE